jgi:hypothetical protein
LGVLHDDRRAINRRHHSIRQAHTSAVAPNDLIVCNMVTAMKRFLVAARQCAVDVKPDEVRALGLIPAFLPDADNGCSAGPRIMRTA